MIESIQNLVYYYKNLRFSKKHNNTHEIGWYQYLVDAEIDFIKKAIKWFFIGRFRKKKVNENNMDELPF